MTGSRLAAVTGATGFLGAQIVRALAARGYAIRILARRDPVRPLWQGLEPQVVVGGLSDKAALTRLCAGAEVVVHCAGLVKARDPATFRAINADGARDVALAAGPDAHVVLVSSLAAREPQLSDYAASKREGETASAAVLGQRLTVVRPPAIYGPGDRETFALFRAASQSPVLPVFDPAARIAVIHVRDCADQIAALAERRPAGATYALSDPRPEGYGWRDLMVAAAQACGRSPHLVRLPDGLLTLVGTGGGLARALGATPILTPGKARELRHLDWSVSPHEQAADLPAATFGLTDGFSDTVNWCRKMDWLAI
jgi:uncharacterized protein YbjT (DUF2867 family)